MVTSAIPPAADGAKIAKASIKGAGVAMSAMARAMSAMYRMGGAMDEYIDRHIAEMKQSENSTISRTGHVLEMAKLGFGIGYISSVIVMAAGQIILGNPLDAVITAGTAATLTNPIAMTCAAVGAILYGWQALSDAERNELLEKLSSGLQVGGELIKSVVGFVIAKTKEILSSKNIEEIKRFISSAAGMFGRTLSDVTRKITDVVSDTVDSLRVKSSKTLDQTVAAVAGAAQSVTSAAGKVVRRTAKPQLTDAKQDKNKP
jgi:hypothetical protein